MTYLITQIALCLLAAFLLGVLIGWLLASFFGGGDTTGLEQERDDARKDADDARGLLLSASAQSDDARERITALETALAAMTGERDAAVTADPGDDQLQLKHDVLVQRLQEAEQTLAECRTRCNELREARSTQLDDANLTARIAELEGQVADAQSQRDADQDLRVQFEHLKTQNTEYEARIHQSGTLQGSLETANSTIAALTAKLAMFEKPDPDNLKKVEGIGPKIQGLLNDNGVWTWLQLSQADVEDLRAYVMQGGDHMKVHDPKTWPSQAKLAHEGSWDELTQLQAELKGGKKG